jgi:hypothetical protein
MSELVLTKAATLSGGEGTSELKRKRSSVLHQMQIMGIDTTDWKCVNELCLNKRIAGKLFHKLSYEELDAVLVKLRIIKRKSK